MALKALKRLMLDVDGNYAEDVLRRLHHNIFKELLQPKVINSTKAHVHMAIIKGVLDICSIIEQRGQEVSHFSWDSIFNSLTRL